jgi:hypothetical protein
MLFIQALFQNRYRSDTTAENTYKPSSPDNADSSDDRSGRRNEPIAEGRINNIGRLHR